MSREAVVPTEEETRQLIARYQAGDREAGGLLIQGHARLVSRVVVGFRSMTWISFEDLSQEGAIAILKAAKRFDLERDTKFSTYATWWILACVQDAVRKLPFLPQESNSANLDYSSAIERQSVADDGKSTVDTTDMVLWIMSSVLDEREQQVLSLLFGLDDGIARTLPEIGKRLGLGRDRVGDIKRAAFGKIRAAYEESLKRGAA